MINQLRTLLLNIDGSQAAGQAELGDKYVPETYRARKMNNSLSIVRQLLFGSAPDRAMLNYRTWQLLQCIDAAGVSLPGDKRVTYDLRKPEYYSREEFLPHVIAYGAASQNDILLVGELAPCDATGKMRREFTITISGPECDVIDHAFGVTNTIPLSYSNGLSDLISLNNSGLFIRLRDSGDRRYTVRGYARPAASLGTIVKNLKQVSSFTFEELFSGENGDLYRDLWENNPDTATKLAGLSAAIAETTNSLATDEKKPSFEVIDIQILQQPAEVTFVEYDTETTLSVVATGVETYQWQYSDDGVNWFNVNPREPSIDLLGTDPVSE